MGVEVRHRIQTGANQWAGQIARTTGERLPKRSETKEQEGCRKLGRHRLSWEFWVKKI